MNTLFTSSIGVLTLLAFSAVMITGILSGNDIWFSFERGLIAAGCAGTMWGLVGYIAFGEDCDKVEEKKDDGQR